MSETGAQQGEQAPQPIPCSAGCGFYANPACMGLCSKCYREHNREAQETSRKELPSPKAEASSQKEKIVASPQPAVGLAEVVQPIVVEKPQETDVSPLAAPQSEGSPDRPIQKQTNRCWNCKKKVGLTGFKCRCGYVFCGTHRYPEAHSCDFDFKTMERKRLQANNPVIAPSKLEQF